MDTKQTDPDYHESRTSAREVDAEFAKCIRLAGLRTIGCDGPIISARVVAIHALDITTGSEFPRGLRACAVARVAEASQSWFELKTSRCCREVDFAVFRCSSNQGISW